jgi:holo-[acyl-carrier protein] synthase
MILGIGIDSIEIDRFKHWHIYSDKQLAKIFSFSEIVYCRENQMKSAERFATRFAAREALFKSISFLSIAVPFLKLCKAVQIKKNSLGKPEIVVNWQCLNVSKFNCTIWVSLTHTKTIATAIVILEKK